MTLRVYMGVTPAPAISTEAMYKTVELIQENSLSAANLSKRFRYVDDFIAYFT